MDELQYRPAEASRTEEFCSVDEAEPVTAEGVLPEEDRTFWTVRHPAQPQSAAKKKKAKRLTTAAAILAAAGVTAFAGIGVTSALLRIDVPEEPAAQTETAEVTEYTEPTRN